MTFVLDASVALAWLFPDERTAYTEMVRSRLASGAAIVSAVWPLEVANGLLVAQRRGRVSHPEVLQLLLQLPITVQSLSQAHAWGQVLAIARSQNLTAYDASYLEIALREGLPLATQDTDLLAAAGRIGVPTLQ